jgi:hypothetical protein
MGCDRSSSVHVLGAFKVLHNCVSVQPSYISAPSDVNLMWFAYCRFETVMTNIDQRPEILAIMQTMHTNASKEVQNVSGDSSAISDLSSGLDIIARDNFSASQIGNDGREDWLFGLGSSDVPLFDGIAEYSNFWDIQFQVIYSFSST